jgi:hypothetical protein
VCIEIALQRSAEQLPEKHLLRDAHNLSGFKACHSERSEESRSLTGAGHRRFLAALGMTSLPPKAQAGP